MSNLQKYDGFVLDSYIKKNREKLDESLVSLRLMKEVDDFLEMNGLNQKELAESIGYTESYVSQLMTGVKKANTSFINKFEKVFKVKIRFSIRPDKHTGHITKLSNADVSIIININTGRELDYFTHNQNIIFGSLELDNKEEFNNFDPFEITL